MITWDNLGRITSADYGESIVKFNYTYVANKNNIYRKTFDHRPGDPYNEYTYDDLDHLTDATHHNSQAEEFHMDNAGRKRVAGACTIMDSVVLVGQKQSIKTTSA